MAFLGLLASCLKSKSHENRATGCYHQVIAKSENPKGSLDKKLKAFVGKSETWIVSA